MTISCSLLVEQWLNIGHHVVRVDAVGEELDDLTLAIEEVLGEVPSNLAIWRLCLEVLVDGGGIVALNIDLAHDRESSLVVRGDKILDL